MGKIFDISFAKTGTTSLATAVGLLGYKSSHNCPDQYKEDFLSKVPYGRFNLNIIDDYDFIGNLLFNYYPVLDVQFPGSKFVFLQRDEEEWAASMLAQMKRVEKNLTFDVGTFNRLANINFVSTNNIDWLIFKYRQHNEGVMKYFGNRSDLLIMSITDGWKPLCDFLSLPVPSMPFPRLNASYRPVLL